MVAYLAAVSGERLPPFAAAACTPTLAAVATAASKRQPGGRAPGPPRPLRSARRAIADAGLRAGAAGDQRQPAVVVQEVEAELGAVLEVWA